MSDQPKQFIWRRIDPETGDIEDYAGCPDCQGKDDMIAQFERQIRTLNGKLTRLERSEKEKAEQHKRWDEAEAIHDWWALATGHYQATFDEQDFKDMLPRLKEKRFGPIGILHGIAGAAADPQERPMANGRVERYDSLELICRSAKKLEGFQNRAPGEPDTDQWKFWLVRQIESSFR